jgi:hypothetical protein
MQNIKPPQGGKRVKAQAKSRQKKQRRYPPGTTNV